MSRYNGQNRRGVGLMAVSAAPPGPGEVAPPDPVMPAASEGTAAPSDPADAATVAGGGAPPISAAAQPEAGGESGVEEAPGVAGPQPADRND